MNKDLEKLKEEHAQMGETIKRMENPSQINEGWELDTRKKDMVTLRRLAGDGDDWQILSITKKGLVLHSFAGDGLHGIAHQTDGGKISIYEDSF